MRWFHIFLILFLIIIGIMIWQVRWIDEKLTSFTGLLGEPSPQDPPQSFQDFDEDLKPMFDPKRFKENQEQKVQLVVVGDLMLSRNVGQKMVKYGDYRHPYLKTNDLLQKADLTFGNLESPLIEGPPVHTPSMIFRADPECASALKWAGFDVLSLANNHIMNKGQAGLNQTLEHLGQVGILGVGAGRNLEEAHAAKILERKGLKIAFLAYVYPGNPTASEEQGGAAIMDLEKLKEDIARTKNGADIIIVSMHAGSEYTRHPNKLQISFAQTAIDAGAALVIGHHPHWFQTIEKYKEKYILYSLGNFVFDQMWSEETREGMVTSIYLDQNGVSDIEFFPIKIFDYHEPRFVKGSENERLLSLLAYDFSTQPLLAWEKGAIVKSKRRGIYSPQPFAHVPERREFDLDQDGEREEVIFQENRLTVLKGDFVLWQSDSDWVIVDYALGDFNHDGFPEIALAFWKQGDYAPGAPLETQENKENWGSHLFLYSFAEGKGKLLWGSSALKRPMLELDSGDLNADQIPELVVLEGDPNDPYRHVSQKLSVMQWDSWGFSQKAEKMGDYYNLRVYNMGDLGYYVYVNELVTSN